MFPVILVDLDEIFMKIDSFLRENVTFALITT